MAKKIGKFIKWFSIAFTFLALAVMFTPLSNLMATGLTMPEDLKRSDVAVVLGGGAYGNGVLGKASDERLVRGLLLYKDNYSARLFFSGGTVLTPVNKILHTVFGTPAAGDSGVAEADIMEEIALKLGVPGKDVAVDDGSTNTYENLKETKKYMGGKGLKSCLIVTSPTHMKRAALVARKLGMDFHPAPVPDYTILRTSAADRIVLFREVIWEYAGLALYSYYGYI